jgi:hypothetical protein
MIKQKKNSGIHGKRKVVNVTEDISTYSERMTDHVDRMTENLRRKGERNFRCIGRSVSRPALGPTQPPIQWVSGGSFLGVKRPGREADHPPPYSAELKNVWSYTSIPPLILHGVVLS